MAESETTATRWYPSKKLNYIVGFALAILVESTSTSFLRDPGGFIGGLLVELLLIFCFPLGIAGLASQKGKKPFVFGWVLLVSLFSFAVLAFFIAHQSIN